MAKDRSKARNRIDICIDCKQKRMISSKDMCSSCYPKYKRIKNKNLIIKEKGGKCSVCGYNKCYAALDFHHIENKTTTLSKILHYSIDKVKAEADKCILVCANCHRIIEEIKPTNSKIGKHRKKYTLKAKKLKGNKCSVCGYSGCIKSLEFHHIIKKDKKFGICDGNTRSWKKILNELKKCILVCANCHREIHYMRD